MANVSTKDAGRTFLVNLLIHLTNIGTSIITARLLQPEGRGELAAVILWPMIIAGLGILGTNWTLAREAAAGPGKEADLARTAVVLGLLQAALFAALGYWLVPHLLPGDKQHLTTLARLFLLFIPLNFISLNLIALEQGGLRWRDYNLMRLSFFLTYGIILVWFGWHRVDRVAWFVFALLISNLSTTIFCLWLQRSNIYRGRVSFSEAIRVMRRGLPFFLAAASGIAALQLDKAMVVSLLSSKEVGWYAAAFAFASAHASMGEALGVTSFAAMANEPDAAGQRSYVGRVFRQATLLYLAATAVIVVLAPIGIVLLFGASFGPAVGPAAILALGTGLAALGQILNESLRGLGRVVPGISAQLLWSGLMALSAWLLVPFYGITGLAWAVVLGSLGQLALLAGLSMSLFSLRAAELWGLRLVEVKNLFLHLMSLWPLARRVS